MDVRTSGKSKSESERSISVGKRPRKMNGVRVGLGFFSAILSSNGDKVASGVGIM